METTFKMSLSKFFCEKCSLIFEGTGKKNEYMHPVYGACSSVYSVCPQCGLEAAEYRPPKPKVSKNHASVSPCGNGSCSCCM